MRFLSGLNIGVIAVAAIIVVTEGFNAIYGHSLGRFQLEAWGLALAAAAIGIIKVYSPFIVAEAWRRREINRFLCGLLLLGGCLIVGHFSTIGVISERKLDRAAEREAKTESKELSAERITELKQKLSGIPAGQPSKTIEAEITKTAKDFSIKWEERKALAAKLNIDLANARARESAEEELKELRNKADGKVALVADAQAAMLKAIYGGDERSWQFWTTLGFAYLLDIISTFGMFLMRSPTPPAPSAGASEEEPEEELAPANDNKGPGAKILQHPHMKQFTAFYDDCIVEEPGSNVGAADLYKAYRGWCKEKGEAPLSNSIAGQYFALMIDKDSDGKARREYLNIRLAEERKLGKVHPDPPSQATRFKRWNEGLLRLGGV